MAIRDTLSAEMERDDKVFVMGEDVEVLGGSFGCTRGLAEKFGAERCFNTPISEAGFVGAGLGATVGKINGPLHAMKSGLGIWACESEGVKCGAVAVVNALGDVLKDGQIIAGCTDNDGSFADSQKILMERVNEDQIIDRAANTTLVCVITNAKVTKSEANKVAQVMHDGLADSIGPVHTNADGDATFCMTSGEVKVNADALSAMARLATKNAIVNAALNAGDAYGLPAAK